MLKFCVGYDVAISYYFNKRVFDGMQKLTIDDWNVAFAFMGLLEVFYNVTWRLSGMYYPISHWLSHIYIQCLLFLLSNVRMQSLNLYVRLWNPNSKNMGRNYLKFFILIACIDTRMKPSILVTTLDYYYLNPTHEIF